MRKAVFINKNKTIMRMRLGILGLGLVLCLGACRTVEEEHPGTTLFTRLSSTRTGIDFRNDLSYDKDFNIYTYRNFYNGGGVAVGDLDNDGYPDLYFTANMGPNRLYRNLGCQQKTFQFEDITNAAGVAGSRVWSTGVSMADVNGDGWLDIYVCNSGDVKGDNRQNELYINNHDLTFTESAEAYGLADRGLSTHAAFFDYDNDGDLDMYLLNNSYQAIGSFNLRKNERPVRDSLGGDKLFRHDVGPDGKPHFVDVSAEAGIYGSIIGFGLGVTVGDLNKDGWMDLYISNDFFERDYLYLNNRNGTFHECLEQQMRCTSAASMGADMADLNNDAYPDIFVTDMLPELDERLKTKTTFDNWNRYQYALDNGYYHQFTRNTLQLNNGRTDTGGPTFSEVGRLAGMEATDWSWGALITDLDNDGYKDVFIANGIYQDLTDQDFLNFIANDQIRQAIVTKEGVDFKKLIEYIPSNPIANYAFSNQGGLQFMNQAKDWGLDTPGFSNGSAYGDLDNDGDLDLVVNNVNMPAFVYRNEADTLASENHYLCFQLKGERKNTFAIGANITIRHRGQTFYLEQMPMRGFESTVDPRPHFGLGKLTEVDTVWVQWPSGKATLLTHVATNQTLTLSEREANHPNAPVDHPNQSEPIFRDISPEQPLDFRHTENQFVDFDRDPLLYHMLSSQGPKMCQGDVNGDGREDFYIGNAKDSLGAFFLQLPDGRFSKSPQATFEADKVSEDTGSLLFDADGDGDLDLYVCSGGSEFPNSSTALINRLYFNDGKGHFSRSNQLLPTAHFESTSCVKAADYDRDGDQDLFVGVRMQPFGYGLPVNGYILNNNGKGQLTDVTAQVAPGLKGLGMITDALWEDVDADGKPDLIVVGEWMPVTLFRNEGGTFSNVTEKAGLAKSNGWWNTIKAGDFDHDGDIDFVLGNHGLNSRFRASAEKPLAMYVHDFDQNGSVEQLVCTYNGDRSLPLVLKHDLVAQMPMLKKKYLKYASYPAQSITDLFTPAQLEKALKLEAYTMATSLLENTGKGTFVLKPLPTEAQFAPVYSLLVHDFDGDGNDDILLGGNFYRAKPEVGRYDASYGCLLKGDGKANFQPVHPNASGLLLNGEVRDMLLLKPSGRVLVSRNNDSMQVLRFEPVRGRQAGNASSQNGRFPKSAVASAGLGRKGQKMNHR